MEATYCLCAGRHKTPVQKSIFANSLDPLDINGMEEIAAKKLAGVTKLTLYVTGLTVALISVVNVCHRYGITLTLMHYDLASGQYYSQSVN